MRHFKSRDFVVNSSTTSEFLFPALQCNRYRARTIMNVAMNNKCYYAWPRRRGTYNEAVKLCQKGGTHVLFTETKEEHHRLISRLGPAFTRIWIGLERNGSEWRWQGGQRSRPVEKLLFADNHKSTKGHNAIVSKSKGQYIWQVQDPNKTFQMVCEQEQGKNTADRVFEESSPDGRYETTGGLG
ncbi:E-selectin-like [Haliotis rubra]|uniref:E-selectin-like n=1 Tax=Haliotis rubra TaxID=36100 RepID=UPI001EE5096B|nr:E-selectin-like [Haliotis rubra]